MKKLIKTVTVLFFLLLWLFGCSGNLKREKIIERKSVSMELPGNTILSTWESESVYWHPSSFRIEVPGKIIYIDPVDIADPVAADVIFITHSHPDHFSIPDIRKIFKDETKIICPAAAGKGLTNFSPIVVKPGNMLVLGDVVCETVPAYNFVHQKAFGFAGYVITVNGLRFYHAGDTDFIPEMKNISGISVAMVPIGTGILAMNADQAAKAVNIIKPVIAVPMHYELNSGKASVFRSLVDKSIQVEIMEH